MLTPRQAAVPPLVRVKPGALDRLGVYAERHAYVRAAVFFSSDLKENYLSRLTTSLREHNIEVVLRTAVRSAAFEEALEHFQHLPPHTDVIIGLGGGKALDVAKYVGFLALSQRPRLHGLQAGVATYLMSILHGQNTGTIAGLFDDAGFWRSIEADPFDRGEWIEAARVAPNIKDDYYTIFSSRDCVPEIERAIDTDPRLQRCFAKC